MFGIGMPEMMVIMVIALVVIGPSKLPEIARAIGKTYGEFSKSMRGIREDFDDMTSEFEEERQMIENPIETIAKKAKSGFYEEGPSSSKTSRPDTSATPDESTPSDKAATADNITASDKADTPGADREKA